MSLVELQQFGVGSIWRKRVAPAHFELRRITAIEQYRIHTESHINGPREFYDYEFVDLYAPLTNDPGSLVLAGSGHRPEHIARGNRTLEEVRDQIFGFYVDLLRWLRPREIVTGLARGFDMWFGWAGVQAGVPVVGAKPYPEQVRGWAQEDAEEWSALADACAEVYTVSSHFWEKEGDNALHARNRWMIDRATHLTSFWQGTRGGTAHANDYAVLAGKPRLVINTLNGW